MDFIELALIGFATGIGSALGNYIATTKLITRMEGLKDKLKETLEEVRG